MNDLELRAGDAVFNIDLRGGGMRALRVGDWDVLDGYAAGQAHSGRRGHVLAPWPNRLYEGRYNWGGVDHVTAITDALHRSAIHGLVDKIGWQVESLELNSAALSVRVPRSDGYPFEVSLGVRYELSQSDLKVTLAAHNHGCVAAPFGAGMHPYFRCGAVADQTQVDLAVVDEMVLGEHRRPTGEFNPFAGDLGLLGSRVLDAGLRCDPRSSKPAATLAGPAGTITVSLGPSYTWLMVFTGDTLPESDRRQGIAIEPMTCPPNAFADGVDVITLAPGGDWSDWWSVAWAPA